MEIWKDVKGYEGLYQVSNKGNVKSVNRIIFNSLGVKRNLKETLLKLSLDKDGYPKVCLCKKNVKNNFFVHRLVAEAFLGNPDELPAINHKNEIKDDNNVENLEFCTSKYNANYGTRNKRIDATRKKKPVVGTNLKNGEKIYFESIFETGSHGFAPNAVSLCCYKKRLKKHKGYSWDFLKTGGE